MYKGRPGGFGVLDLHIVKSLHSRASGNGQAPDGIRRAGGSHPRVTVRGGLR